MPDAPLFNLLDTGLPETEELVSENMAQADSATIADDLADDIA